MSRLHESQPKAARRALIVIVVAICTHFLVNPQSLITRTIVLRARILDHAVDNKISKWRSTYSDACFQQEEKRLNSALKQRMQLARFVRELCAQQKQCRDDLDKQQRLLSAILACLDAEGDVVSVGRLQLDRSIVEADAKRVFARCSRLSRDIVEFDKAIEGFTKRLNANDEMLQRAQTRLVDRRRRLLRRNLADRARRTDRRLRDLLEFSRDGFHDQREPCDP